MERDTRHTGAPDRTLSPRDLRYRRQARLLCWRFGSPPGQPVLIVSVDEQKLFVFEAGERVQEYPVSTSRFGTGSVEESYKTPGGAHRVYARIGDAHPKAEIFRGRKPTGEIGRIITSFERGGEDAISSRILQLRGLDAGINLGSGIGTLERNIYIHGTLEEGLIGTPASIGCVRMKNDDIIELCERVPVGALVRISA